MARKTSANDTLQDNLFRELRTFAEQRGIEVRCEKLSRDHGFRVRSGTCTVRGNKWVIVDRALPARERFDFLADELRDSLGEQGEIPANLRPFFQI